jgi:flagellar basal body-associated protein FliL
MSNETGNNGGSKGGKIAIACGIVVIIALLVVIVILLLNKKDTTPVETRDDVAARGVVVNQQNAEEVLDDFVSEPTVAMGYYTVSMTNEWHFATADAVSADAYVRNLEENTNDVYFDVFLTEDEDNAIYKSPIIPRGAELEDIKLDKEMSAGTYDCVLIYHLIDGDMKEVSTLRVGVKVIIEN